MKLERTAAIEVLNAIVEHELAGMVRYTQYSMMVFGHARIPIISWMKEQALEALAHATQAGEEVTSLSGKVSLEIGALVGTHHDRVDQIMEELIVHEEAGITLYERLLELTQGRNVSLEELARAMIRAEQIHVSEIRKMLGRRGDA
jgi:bacterioferritin